MRFNGTSSVDASDTSGWTWRSRTTGGTIKGYIVLYLKPVFSTDGFAWLLSLDPFNTGQSVNIFFNSDGSGQIQCRVSGNPSGYIAGLVENDWNCVELLYEAGFVTLAVNGTESDPFFVSQLPDDQYDPSEIRIGWSVNEAFLPLPDGCKVCDFFKCDGENAVPDSTTRASLQAREVDPATVLSDIVEAARFRDDVSTLIGTTVFTNDGCTFDSDFPFELGGGEQEVDGVVGSPTSSNVGGSASLQVSGQAGGPTSRAATGTAALGLSGSVGVPSVRNVAAAATLAVTGSTGAPTEARLTATATLRIAGGIGVPTTRASEGSLVAANAIEGSVGEPTTRGAASVATLRLLGSLASTTGLARAAALALAIHGATPSPTTLGATGTILRPHMLSGSVGAPTGRDVHGSLSVQVANVPTDLAILADPAWTMAVHADDPWTLEVA